MQTMAPLPLSRLLGDAEHTARRMDLEWNNEHSGPALVDVPVHKK